jgi:bisphosphoglycerate-dependent phosphoglycerate mutase
MEIVPVESSWILRERFWIYSLRTLYADVANISDGGTGVLGHIVSAETRIKIGNAGKGRIASTEARAKMSIAATQRKRKPLSAEQKLRISERQKGKKRGPQSAEHRSKIGANRIGKKRAPFSSEWRAKMSAAQKRRYQRTEGANA